MKSLVTDADSVPQEKKRKEKKNLLCNSSEVHTGSSGERAAAKFASFLPNLMMFLFKIICKFIFEHI